MQVLAATFRALCATLLVASGALLAAPAELVVNPQKPRLW
jgi:hypothetical protein